MTIKCGLAICAAVFFSASAGAQNLQFPFAQSFSPGPQSNADYQRGLSELDAHQWQKAVATFSAVAKKKTPGLADAALYWEAYAASKLVQTKSALDSLDTLQRTYPLSRWVNDAKALKIEMRMNPVDEMRFQRFETQVKTSDKPADPDQEMKLIAINSLLQSDPASALPILRKVLADSNNSEKVKERALFVLAQSSSPEAHKILLDTAQSSGGNMQLKAVTYLGMSDTEESRKELLALYQQNKGSEVRKAVLEALVVQQNGKALVNLARNEKDPAMKLEIVRMLSFVQTPETKEYLMELLK